MKVISIVDDDYGIMFNNRRVSKDSVLNEHIIKMLNASKQTIENAITENSKKVIAYKRELGLNTMEDTTVLKVNVDLTKD